MVCNANTLSVDANVVNMAGGNASKLVSADEFVQYAQKQTQTDQQQREEIIEALKVGVRVVGSSHVCAC